MKITVHVECDETEVDDVLKRLSNTSLMTDADMPVVASPAPVVSPVADDVDKNGIPWDERIHAGTKGKTKEGVWKRRKGVSQEDHDAIAATLGTPTPAPVQTVVPSVDDVSEPDLPAFMDRQTSPTARSPEPSDEYTAFKTLIDHHVFQATPGFIDWLNGAMSANEVASLPDLADRPDLWEFMTGIIVQHFGDMPNG